LGCSGNTLQLSQKSGFGSLAGKRFFESRFLASVFAPLNDAATLLFGLIAIAQSMRMVTRPEVLVAGYRPNRSPVLGHSFRSNGSCRDLCSNCHMNQGRTFPLMKTKQVYNSRSALFPNSRSAPAAYDSAMQ